MTDRATVIRQVRALLDSLGIDPHELGVTVPTDSARVWLSPREQLWLLPMHEGATEAQRRERLRAVRAANPQIRYQPGCREKRAHIDDWRAVIAIERQRQQRGGEADDETEPAPAPAPPAPARSWECAACGDVQRSPERPPRCAKGCTGSRTMVLSR